MTKCVKVADRLIGDGNPCFIIAEIGINHNGSVNLAKKMIDIAVTTGCDAVKFQKRTVDVVYTKEELAMPRQSVFGETNGDLKRGLEFGIEEYKDIPEEYYYGLRLAEQPKEVNRGNDDSHAGTIVEHVKMYISRSKKK